MKKHSSLFSPAGISIVCLFILAFITAQFAAAQDPADHEPAEIQDIRFWMDDKGALSISLSGRGISEPVLNQADESIIEFLLPDTSVRPDLIRLYRLDEFEAQVNSLFVQNIESGTRLILSWNRQLPYEIIYAPEEVSLKFPSAGVYDIALDKQARDTTGAVSDSDLPQRLPEQGHVYPGMRGEYTGEPISIDLQDAEVEHVIRLITSITDYNLIIDDHVQGRISLKLTNVPWDQALDLVLVQKSLGMVLQGDIMRIATQQQLEQERQRVRRAREEALQDRENLKQLEPLQQELIQINYSTAGEILPQVQDFMSERGQVTQDPRTNILIVQDIESRIPEIKALVNRLDRPEKQVHIEARIVYASEEFRRGLGIQWNFMYPEQNAFSPDGNTVSALEFSSLNFPSLPDTFGTLVGSLDRKKGSRLFTLDAELRLGEAQNRSRTVSAPRIVTLNNQEARIEQGFQIPYTTQTTDGPATQFEEATLSLLVTTQITSSNDIMLTIEVTDDTPVSAFGVTAIETRSARSRLLVENGETIVIGGIKKTIEGREENRIPGAGDIPFLGWLFKNRYVMDDKNELLIFLRTEVI